MLGVELLLLRHFGNGLLLGGRGGGLRGRVGMRVFGREEGRR